MGDANNHGNTGRLFTAWLVQRRYASATVAAYVGYVQRAESAVGPLDALDAAVLYGWWTTLPATASTRNGARKALVAFYRARGDRTGGPAAELPAWPNPDRPPRPVAGPAFGALRAAAADLGGIHQALAVVLATTGCRISEARLARWEQFSFDGDRSAWRITGKSAARRGPKQRDVPVHPSTVAVLRAWRRECGSRGWVFPSPLNAGRPISDTAMRRLVYEIADHACVDDHVNPHRWRHTAATLALEATHDLAAVQDLLGHADPSTTRRYTLTSPSRLRDAVNGAADGYYQPPTRPPGGP